MCIDIVISVGNTFGVVRGKSFSDQETMSQEEVDRILSTLTGQGLTPLCVFPQTQEQATWLVVFNGYYNQIDIQTSPEIIQASTLSAQLNGCSSEILGYFSTKAEADDYVSQAVRKAITARTIEAKTQRLLTIDYLQSNPMVQKKGVIVCFQGELQMWKCGLAAALEFAEETLNPETAMDWRYATTDELAEAPLSLFNSASVDSIEVPFATRFSMQASFEKMRGAPNS